MTELDEFKQEVSTWLDSNCPQSMRRPIVTEEMVWGSSRLQFLNADQQVWFERMRERGWFAPSWPREYGGGGLNPKQARVLETEMARLGCRQAQRQITRGFAGLWRFVDMGRGSVERYTQTREQFSAVSRGGAQNQRTGRESGLLHAPILLHCTYDKGTLPRSAGH